MDKPNYEYFTNSIRYVLGLNKQTMGITSLFEIDKKYLIEDFMKWINKIKKRVVEITNLDINLREKLLFELELLENKIKLIKKSDMEWEIIPSLMNVISNLVGFEHGDINRNCLFYQNFSQEMKSLKNKGKYPTYEDMAKFSKYRIEEISHIVNELHKKGYTIYQIHTIVRLPQLQIRKMLQKSRLKRPPASLLP